MSCNGNQLELPYELPASQTSIQQTANVSNRFVLNDTDYSYTQPYTDRKYLERKTELQAFCYVK